jgi:hypothetical protein
MSGETNENENEDLKAFEAALSSLRPRTDRLDCRWRSLLAKEATLTAETEIPIPAGSGKGGEDALTLALSQKERRQVRCCIDPTGHRFVCVRCGTEAIALSGFRRCRLPVALAAATSAAVVLLVMFVTHRVPSSAPSGSSGSSSSVAAGQTHSFTSTEGVSLSELAEDNVGQSRFGGGEGTMSYACLRAQVFRHGVEWLDHRPSRAAIPMTSPDEPLSNREFLGRVLEEQRGS